jgi:hypothetical protein
MFTWYLFLNIFSWEFIVIFVNEIDHCRVNKITLEWYGCDAWEPIKSVWQKKKKKTLPK